MANFITTAITGYVKETTEILLKPFFMGKSPFETQGVKVRTNITGTEKLNYFGRANKILKKYAKGFNPASGTTYTQRDISVSQMKAEMAQDANEFYNTVLEILQAKGYEWNDVQAAKELPKVILQVFVEGLAQDIFRQFWLNDTNKETLDVNGNYSGTADTDYNAYKGIWQHIFENATITPTLANGDIQLVALGTSELTAAAVAQVDTVTLTGTSGTANVTLGGVAYLATFDTDIATTSANFVSTHAAALALRGITLTGTTTLIFTSAIKGQPFASPTTANVTGDLAGSTVNTTANTAPSAVKADGALSALDKLYIQAPQVLRHTPKMQKVFLMDFEMYNNYELSLRSLNATENGRTQLINGVEVLTYNGIPVLNLEWAEFIGADFPHATTDKAARENRILYTAVDNLILAIDAKSEFNKLETWYNKDEQENRFRAQLKIGANYIHNEAMAVAYEI